MTDEDLELKALKLRKLMRLAALKAEKERQPERRLSFEEAMKILKENLEDRGDEVLEAAIEQYPERAKKVAMILAEKVARGELRRKLSGGALMSLFEYLGMPVKLKTKILYYKKGEYKSIADLLK
ncbi:MAG: hypothetical protein DRN54_01110 [Thaumarchaeota archaeon]|nr:MAG: hypothetical protein DRN54_01110 [Nitrososphaerota archaeon]